jgi:hypothetical protein
LLQNESGNLHSDLAYHDICVLEPPFEPEKCVQAIQEAEKAGYDTIIIDSLSHAWAGQGGILEYVGVQRKVESSSLRACWSLQWRNMLL